MGKKSHENIPSDIHEPHIGSRRPWQPERMSENRRPRSRRSVTSTQEIGYKLFDILREIERKREDDALHEVEGEWEEDRRGQRSGVRGHKGRQRSGKGTYVYMKPSKGSSKKDLIFLGKVKNELSKRRFDEGEEEPEVKILLDAIRKASELLIEIED